MSVLNKLNLDGTSYDIGANIKNIYITDNDFIDMYGNDILFVAGVIEWKKKLNDYSLKDIQLIEVLNSNNPSKYLLSIRNTEGQHEYYNINGDIVDVNYSNACLKSDIIDLLDSNGTYVNLEWFVSYLMNNDITMSFDKELLNNTTLKDSLDECDTFYEVLKFFNSKIAGPTERILHITDYSQPMENSVYEPRTKHVDNEIGQDEDVDIVLVTHEGDILTPDEKTEDGKVPKQYQTVRLYKKDGAVEFGSGSSAGESAFSAGHYTQANGKYSVAMGDNTTANGIGSIALGQNVTTNSNGTVALGTYNISDSDAVLVVGNGQNGDPSNVFKANKDGTSWSKSKITIAADDTYSNTDAELTINNDALIITKEGDIKAHGYEILNGQSNNNGSVLDVQVDNDTAFKVTTDFDTYTTHDNHVGNDEFVGHDATIENDEYVKHNLTVGNYIIDGNDGGDTVKKVNVTTTTNPTTGVTETSAEKFPGNKIYNTTYSRNLNPTKDMSYDLGVDHTPTGEKDKDGNPTYNDDYLRWRKLYVNDIDATGNIVANGLKVKSLDVDDDKDKENPYIELKSSLWPADHKGHHAGYEDTDAHDIYFSLGDASKRWADGYFGGRLFSESLNAETLTRKFGTQFMLERCTEYDSTDYNSMFYHQTTSTIAAKKYGPKEKWSHHRLFAPANSGGIKMSIDYATGKFSLYWRGATETDINFNNKRKIEGHSYIYPSTALGYRTRPVARVFHPASLICYAIGRDIPLTFFVDGHDTVTRYTGFLKCTSNNTTVWNNFINNYSNPSASKATKIFHYHNMYCFAKRYGCARYVIDYYKNLRTEAVKELATNGDFRQAMRPMVDAIINAEYASGKGCIFMDSTSAMPKGSTVIISGSIDTGLDYDDLVFIRALSLALSGVQYTASGWGGGDAKYRLDKLRYGGNTACFINSAYRNDMKLKDELIKDKGIIEHYGDGKTSLSEADIKKFFPNYININKDSFDTNFDTYEETFGIPVGTDMNGNPIYEENILRGFTGDIDATYGQPGDTHYRTVDAYNNNTSEEDPNA